MQTHLLTHGLYIFSDEPLVVCAPTGSGKTVLFELAIVRLLQNIEIMSNPEDFKIVYSKYFYTIAWSWKATSEHHQIVEPTVI